MLLLNINRKPYKESPRVLSHLTLSDLERSKSRSLRFRSLISRKWAMLGHMLLLNLNRKPYMGESNGTFTFDLEWPWKVQLKVTKFRSLISRKRAKLGHTLLLNINRKPYMGSPMAWSDLTLSDLERSNSRSLKISKPYISQRSLVRPYVTTKHQ